MPRMLCGWVAALSLALPALVSAAVALLPQRYLQAIEPLVIGVVLSSTITLLIVDDLVAVIGFVARHRR